MDSLAALVGGHTRRKGWSIAEAARRAGLSYREMYRIIRGDVTFIQPKTIDALVGLGLLRGDVVLAAFGGNGTSASAPVKEAQPRSANGRRRGKATASTS